MYTNVSTSFINKIAQPSRHFTARFYDGTTLLDLEIMHINITTGTCGGSTLAIGCAFAGYIEVTARYTDILLEGKELKLELGLLLDNDSYEYIPFGYWTVQKPSVSQDVMTFTAVDRVAAKLNEEYTSSLTYPTTIANVLSELSTAAGVTINCSLQTTQQIPVAIEGVSQRGALATIAGLLLGCAWADRSGNIQITAYGNSSTDVSVNYDYVKTAPPMDEKATEISGVKVYTVDGQTDTYITVGTAHMVEESNIYMTQTTLDAVANNIVGLEYNGGNVSFMGNPLIDPSDTITFNDGTNDYSVPCMEILHSFDGGLLTTVTAPGSFEATESTIHTGAITQELERMTKATAAAQETADDALTAAGTASTAAESARVLATGKNKIFYSATAPASGMSSGDMWMDTAHGNSLYQYSGSAWTLRQLGQGSIAAGSITADEIAASTITANKMNVSNFSAVSGNIINITAGILTSIDWEYDYEHLPIYSTKGMRISLTDKYIRTPNFAVVNGNLYARNGTFSGSVTATSGNIAGWDINDYQISYYDVESTSAQYGVVVRSKEANSAATPETYHFLVYHRPYENGAYGNWVIDFGVKHNGSFIATSGSLSSISINNGAFSVTPAGVLNATGATISGAITATSGSIGGFTVSSTSNTGTTASGGHVYANSLYTHSSGSETVGSVTTNYEYEAGLAGGGAYNNAAFYIKKMTAGSSWSSSEHVFYVRNDGYMYSARGNIGGWSISDSALSRGGGYNSSTANSMYFGNSGLSIMDKFYVDNTGKAYITDELHVRGNGKIYVENATGSSRASFGFSTTTGEYGLYISTADKITLVADEISLQDILGETVLTLGLVGYVDQGVSLSGRLSIDSTGHGTASALSVTGNATVSGTLTAATLSGVLSATGNSTITGTLQTSGNIRVESTSAAEYIVGIKNSVAEGRFRVAANGVVGLYNQTASKWLIYMNTGSTRQVVIPTLLDAPSSNAGNVYASSTGTLYMGTGSSKRFKKSIKPIEDWKKVLDVPVVSFIFRDGYLSKEDQRYGQRVPGFIAEDVAEFYGIAADRSGDQVNDWNVRFIVPPMLAVEQDHERRIKELEEEIRILKGGVK